MSHVSKGRYDVEIYNLLLLKEHENAKEIKKKTFHCPPTQNKPHPPAILIECCREKKYLERIMIFIQIFKVPYICLKVRNKVNLMLLFKEIVNNLLKHRASKPKIYNIYVDAPYKNTILITFYYFMKFLKIKNIPFMIKLKIVVKIAHN